MHQNGVLMLLRDLKIHKATGPDEVPAFILKSAASQLSPILTRLYQHSLHNGEVPTDWKNAHIVPVFKKREKHLPSNYRPVSLTSIVCKVLEHIVHSSVMNHFDRHKILTDNQHGFRAKRSCESQLITTIQKIASTMSSRGQVDVILLDFVKELDKVPHQRLLHKLDYYGVRNSSLCWSHFSTIGNSRSSLTEQTHQRQTYFLEYLKVWSLGLSYFWHSSTTCQM